MSQGMVVVLTGPSGVGKGTLLRSLFQNHPEMHFSVSATTRGPRPGEVDGRHYYFVDRDEFQRMIDQQELLEWAEFADNFYGTPRQPVIEQLEEGKVVVLEIEVEGARQVRKTFPEALQIFILPPSVEELENRIRRRAQDAEAAIERRLKKAQIEIDAAHEFDLQIVNDDLERTIEQIEVVLFPSVMQS